MTLKDWLFQCRWRRRHISVSSCWPMDKNKNKNKNKPSTHEQQAKKRRSWLLPSKRWSILLPGTSTDDKATEEEDEKHHLLFQCIQTALTPSPPLEERKRWSTGMLDLESEQYAIEMWLLFQQQYVPQPKGRRSRRRKLALSCGLESIPEVDSQSGIEKHSSSVVSP